MYFMYQSWKYMSVFQVEVIIGSIDIGRHDGSEHTAMLFVIASRKKKMAYIYNKQKQST